MEVKHYEENNRNRNGTADADVGDSCIGGRE